MRVRTWVGVIGLIALLGGVILVGVWGPSARGQLHEQWVSPTPRENQLNHHPIGVGPNGETIIAPIAAVPDAKNLTNQSCTLARLRPTDGSVRWRTSIPPQECFTHALTQPAIADIDSDGALESAVSTTEKALIVRNARTGTEEFRVPLSSYGYGQPTIANVTSSPGREIVTSDINGGVIVVENTGTETGTIAWQARLNETFNRSYVSVWEGPIVEDLDADGNPEVAIGTGSGPVVLNATSGVDWLKHGDATHATAAQADDDAALELFTAGANGVKAYDGNTGSLEWQRSLDNSRIHTAADADGDGTVELFVGRTGGDIVAVNANTGDTEWATSIASSDDVRIPAPVLGDVNGDNQSEVIGVTSGGTVTVLDSSSGNERAAYERNVPIRTFATPADIDTDGRDEILVRYGDGRVVALEYTQ